MRRTREKNDGRGRIGGRQKGTPNKTTRTVREWIANILNENQEQFRRDLKLLEPDERVRAITALLPYVTPKQATLSLDEQKKAERDVLTTWLESAPAEAIMAVAERLKALETED